MASPSPREAPVMIAILVIIPRYNFKVASSQDIELEYIRPHGSYCPQVGKCEVLEAACGQLLSELLRIDEADGVESEFGCSGDVLLAVVDEDAL